MKLVRSELRLDLSTVQTSSPGTLLRTCSGNHGNVSGRLPLSVLSTNTLRCHNNGGGGVVTSLRLKTSPGGVLQFLHSPPGGENNMVGLYGSEGEDSDAPLDIWAVIKPGHVREKIAMFASEEARVDAAGTGERVSTGGSVTLPCTGHAPSSGLSRAAKAKGSWEENCNAKRRRRSANNQNLPQDPGSREHTHKVTPRRHDAAQPTGSERGGVRAAEEVEDTKVSVGDMVAFLERIASERQPDAKPLLTLQRSSATIMLARAPPPEVRGEEPEVVRVSDMVAKLESKCLRRREDSDLSRSNSLRRTVGRVLLAAGDLPTSPPMTSSPPPPLPGAQSESGTEAVALTTPPSEAQDSETRATPPRLEGAEPLPGLLFLSPPSDASPHTPTDQKPRPPYNRTPSDPVATPEKRRSSPEEEAEPGCAWACRRRASASQDFLELRQRVQQLLEPQPYLTLLPHHLLLHVLTLLDTRSLAALKCSCRYFHLVIQTYGVRPADSLWVSDPRYRDDPCKQCKRRYARGDVSLCRWHHKPYCQALPYGPGYWMCCHGARRDVPGCNVGLHDNRWVPAFHSINVPVYRRSRDTEDN